MPENHLRVGFVFITRVFRSPRGKVVSFLALVYRPILALPIEHVMDLIEKRLCFAAQFVPFACHAGGIAC